MEKRIVKPIKTEIEDNAEANINGNKIVTSFRHSPDIENFYRFVHENSLRKEARLIFEKVLAKIARPKKRKKAKITQ